MSIAQKDIVAEKIRKLFALAERNGNENEAASALLKARELLRRHGLDAEKIRGGEGGGGVRELEFPLGKPWADWRGSLAEASCELCDAGWFVRGMASPKAALVFFGEEPDIRAALATFESLCASCDAALKREKRRNPNRAKLTAHGREIWTNSFRAGFADRVLERVEALRAQEATAAREEDSSGGEALRWEVVVRGKQDALALYEKKLNLVSAPAEGRPMSLLADGWHGGQAAGDSHGLGRVEGALE